ncbi:MAG: transposase [Verrucomicrobia bacterium]|nr:transposase [Verrucomicrobiota bacterium]
MQTTSSEPAPTTDSTIIRTGSDGRLRYSQTQREELLDAFAGSGMSAMSFSRQHGVHYQTFIAWLRKHRENSSSDVTGPAFAEILLDGPACANPSAALRIVLPCGAAIELTSRAALPLALELLANLRRPC